MIRVVVDDLAALPVDAVVRPASDTLDSGAAAADLLDAAAGPDFVALRRVAAPLDVGAAVITAAGRLSAQYVLHVVIRRADGTVARESVRRALVSAWQRAEAWELATVATPLVGAGEGELSREDSARLLAETFLSRVSASPYPIELCIVVERDEDRAVVAAIVAAPPPPDDA